MGVLDWVSVEKQMPETGPQAPLPEGGGAPPAPPAGGGGGGTTQQPLFLEVKTLTFAGITAAAALIYNFFLANVPGLDPFWFSGVVAGVCGLGLIISGLMDRANKDSKPKQIFAGVVNTFLLWIAIFGATGVAAATTGTTPGT